MPETKPAARGIRRRAASSRGKALFKVVGKQSSDIPLALSSATLPSGTTTELRDWLGSEPENPVQLAFEALKRQFEVRREVLAQTISSDQVVELLRCKSVQTAHDRVKAGSLLAIKDNGKLRFPIGQFDADGPDGVMEGLSEVLKALDLPAVAKAQWLTRPHGAFEGSSPLEALRSGELALVLREAERVGHGQD